MVDIVEFDDFSGVVREDWEVEVVVLGEGFVREWVVYAYSHDLCVDLVQLLHVVPQGAHFTSAYAGECPWEECEYCRAVRFQKFVKTPRFPVSVWEIEGWSFFALVNHSQSSLASGFGYF